MSDAKKPSDFGAKLAELEAITEWFESDEVDLNAALAKFERGMQLAAELKEELQQVESRVEAIKVKFNGAASQAEATDEPEPEAPSGPTLF